MYHIKQKFAFKLALQIFFILKFHLKISNHKIVIRMFLYYFSKISKRTHLKFHLHMAYYTWDSEFEAQLTT